jgi:hypothetical protein
VRTPVLFLGLAFTYWASAADILADLALIILPIRLIRGIKDKRLRWRLIFIFSTSSEYSSFSTNKQPRFFFLVVTTIVSLVHAAYIISRGGIPVVISALVEDCMSLTVANLPVVATASFRRLDSESNNDGDGQRWSTWKFKTRTLPMTTNEGNSATYFTTGLGAGSRSRSVAVDPDMGTATELTSSALEQSKGSVSVGMGAYSLGSVDAEDVFANGTKAVDPRREEKPGVVRIDVLPYSRDQPPPKP